MGWESLNLFILSLIKYLLNWNPSAHFLLGYSCQHPKPSQGCQHAEFLTLEGRKAAPVSFLDWVQSNRRRPRKLPLAKVKITLMQAVSCTPRRGPTLWSTDALLCTAGASCVAPGSSLSQSLSVQRTSPNIDLLQKLPLWDCTGHSLGKFGSTWSREKSREFVCCRYPCLREDSTFCGWSGETLLRRIALESPDSSPSLSELDFRRSPQKLCLE